MQRNNGHSRGSLESSSRVRAFYWLILPALAALNLLLGLANLAALAPRQWMGWLDLLVGAFCCCVAGWLAGAATARAVWRAAAQMQARRWRRLLEVLLKWTEVAPISVTEMRRLKAEAEATLESVG